MLTRFWINNDFYKFVPKVVMPRCTTVLTCPNCQNCIATDIQYYPTRSTHVLALVLLPFLMCWLPFVTTCTKNACHSCSVCHVALGISRTNICKMDCMQQ